VNRAILATLLLGFVAAGPAYAKQGQQRGHHPREISRAPSERLACRVDVLHSEELTWAPIYYRNVRTTLLITPPNRPPFQTILEKLIPWQVPPPRKGQRFKSLCDPASPDSPGFLTDHGNDSYALYLDGFIHANFRYF
jgi:hypothetical protein